LIMPIPPTHVGDNEIHSLYKECYPIIDANETNVDFKHLAWSHLCSFLGQAMQRYFDREPSYRIAWAQYETGQKLVEWYNTTNPYPKPESFNPVNSLKGIVRINENTWEDATGPVYPLGLHTGDLFLCQTEGKDITPILDLAAEYGYHFTRQWITLMWFKQGNSFWGNRGCSPAVTENYYNWIRKNIEMHIERGLKMHLSMGDLNGVSYQDLVSLYTNVANLIYEYGQEYFIFPGEVNESRDTFIGASAADIKSLVDIIRRKNPDIEYALTSYSGYVDILKAEEYTANFQRGYYKHGYRDGRYWDKIRHYNNDGYEYYSQIRVVGADHEPVGVGKWVSVTANKEELNASAMGLIAAASCITRQSFTYLCSPGIKWDEDFLNMPGFTTVPQLIAMLPKGLCNGTLHHSGTTWRNTRVFEAVGEFRVDGSIRSDGLFGYVAYGPGDRIKLPVNRSFDGMLINPSTLEVTSISGEAGNFLPELGYDKGFILTGMVRG
jgi:hypothetical protein